MNEIPVNWKLSAVLLGLAAAVILTGCANTAEPVGERSIFLYRADDRYYDPMSQNWERPWPYGPRGNQQYGR